MRPQGRQHQQSNKTRTMREKTRKNLTTLLGCVVFVLLLGAVGTLEQRCDREEWVLRGMDEDTYYAIQEHVSDSTGRRATRREVARYYLENTGEGL